MPKFRHVCVRHGEDGTLMERYNARDYTLESALDAFIEANAKYGYRREDFYAEYTGRVAVRKQSKN